jgi:hypothetical protein
MNYINRNNALPPSWPGVWVSLDGTVATPIPDVATFDELYAAFVSTGISNFNNLATKLAAVASATTVAQVQGVVW